MTTAERIRELDEMDRTFCGWELAERIKELRSGVTLNDVMTYFDGLVSYKRALNILGFRTVGDGFAYNDEIEQAFEDETVELAPMRQHGKMTLMLIRR